MTDAVDRAEDGIAVPEQSVEMIAPRIDIGVMMQEQATASFYQ